MLVYKPDSGSPTGVIAAVTASHRRLRFVLLRRNLSTPATYGSIVEFIAPGLAKVTVYNTCMAPIECSYCTFISCIHTY